jgi:hypothetical protein
MAFQRDTERILSGGLNLQPPGDLIDATECVAMTNFRADQMGILRARRRETAVLTGYTAPIRTIWLKQGLANPPYGGDTFVSDAASLWVQTSLLATGFDGSKLGLVSFDDQVWVMNQAKQGRVAVSGTYIWRTWEPAPPPAFTAVAVAPGGTRSDAGTTVTAGLTGTYTYYLTYTTVEAYESNLSPSVTLTLAAQNGQLALPPFPAGDPSVILAYIYRSGGTQTQLLRIGQLDGTPTMAGEYTSAVAAPASPLSGAASVTAGTPSGTYYYRATYTTALGESAWGPASAAVITGGAFEIALTAIPVSADPTVTGRRIYRGIAADSMYLVATIADNTATTYTDNAADGTPYGAPTCLLWLDGCSDLDAEEVGLSHTADHDAPPAAKGLTGPYYDRLIAYNSAAHPNWFWWTETDKPWYWPGSDAVEGNHAPVGDDGEAIVHVTVRPGMLIFYKTRSIWRCLGDPGVEGGSRLEPLATHAGLLGDGAIAEAGPLDYFQCQDGIYACNGDSVRKISPKLDPLFLGDTIDTSGFEPKQLATAMSDRGANVMEHRQGKLYFSYLDNVAGHWTLVYDIARNQWAGDSRGFTALYDQGQSLKLLGALAGAGSVYDIEAATTGAMTVNLQTRTLDQGQPDNAKTYGDVAIVHNLVNAGDSLTVDAVFGQAVAVSGGTTTVESAGVTTITLGAISSSSRRETILPINSGNGQEAKNVSIRIHGTVNDEARIYSAHLHYVAEQRDGLTFDTRAIDLGVSHVKEVSAWAADVQTRADLAWSLYADMPSGAMAVVKSGTVAHGGLYTRRGVQLACDLAGEALPEGKLLRLLITSAQPFRLYDLRFLVRRLGVYLVAGQGYHSRELALGSSRIKLAKKLEIDARLDGNLVVSVSSDCPTAWAVRKTQTITATTRRWNEIRLPAVSGRFLRVDLDPAAAARIYAVRMLCKRLGEAGASQWDWYSVPLEPSEEAFAWTAVAVDGK